MAFQLTLPHRERRSALANLVDSKMFQLTLPRGERPGSLYGCVCQECFNSRSCGGSDLPCHADVLLELAFQLTLLRGERPAAE